jgi:hypothetical protein
MNIEPVGQFRRAARIAYSRHPIARLLRLWRCVAGAPAENCNAADILLLPLAGLTLSLFVIQLVPNAGEIIAAAYSTPLVP